MDTSLKTCESKFTCVELRPDSLPALPVQSAQPFHVLTRTPIHSFTIYLALFVPVLVAAAVVVQGLDWSSIESRIRAAAQVELTEDFRNDLSGWATDSGAAQDWTFNAGGFAAPGQLALYIKSIPAADYRMQFRATIGRENLGFVYRAMDFRYYYAGRIVLSTDQPVPTASIEHYSVIDGVEGPRTRVKIPFPMRAGVLYDVKIEARGDHFVTRINDRFVDAFTDNQLQSGGVGFFGGPQKSARISWLRFTAHDDLPGRICSWLTSLETRLIF